MTKRSKKRSRSDSRKEAAKPEQIPLDIVMEILLKLPVKSITRFRCVSKQWDHTIRTPIFTDSFATISSSRPKILIACHSDGKTLIFSTPQPQDPCPLTPSFHMSLPTNYLFGVYRQWAIGATNGTVHSICNLSTGQVLTLPNMRKGWCVVKRCLGYDPIDKQLKVFCTTRSESYGNCRSTGYQHQVLTFGCGEKLLWRRITCDVLHVADDVCDGICINGVLYYIASVYDDDNYGVPGIVCFEVGSEKFSYIKKSHAMELHESEVYNLESILVNYKGKLAMLHIKNGDRSILGIQLWVLEDAKKHQWSSYVLPPLWKWNDIGQRPKLRFVGMTKKGEIVLSQEYINYSFYLVYYNPERNTVAKARIRGMKAYMNCKAFIFLDHVEDVKLL